MKYTSIVVDQDIVHIGLSTKHIPGPLNLELYCDVVPKTCENLIILYQIRRIKIDY